MEWLNNLWNTIAPYVSGISIAGILSAVIYGVLRGAFNKTISKINVKDISEKATEKGIEKIKEVSFKQSIQPLVESELKKITEQANAYIKDELNEVNENYKNLIACIEALAKYFDNSIGVPQSAKDELKEKIAIAKNEEKDVVSNLSEDITVKIETPIVEEKVEPQVENAPKKKAKAIR